MEITIHYDTGEEYTIQGTSEAVEDIIACIFDNVNNHVTHNILKEEENKEGDK